MKQVLYLITGLLLMAGLQQCSYSQSSPPKKVQQLKEQQVMDTNKQSINPVYSRTDNNKVELSDEEWKKILPADVFHIARQKGTERPWSSKYETLNEVGTYYCAACGNALFRSDTKFESGCGWPSFYQPITKGSIIYEPEHYL